MKERNNGKPHKKPNSRGLVRDIKGTDRRLIIHVKITGAWLSVRGTIVSGKLSSATEFWYFLCARYNVSPLNLQSHCNGCGPVFMVNHTLSCSTDGLVNARHNKIRDKIFYLSQRAFTSASVRAEPLIHHGHTISDQEIRQGSDKDKEMRGDVMVRGLWDRQVDTIIDVKLGDADADSYKYEPIEALLTRRYTIKKDNHGKHCHDQWKHFSAFVLSVDIILGREARVVLSQLIQAMA